MKKAILVIALVLVGGLIAVRPTQACFLGFGDDCSTPKPKAADTHQAEVRSLEDNQKRLVGAVQPPILETSQERVNIKRRAELFSSENKISYIYFVSYGKVMAFYTVKGKVSSLRSYMTPQETLVRGSYGPCIETQPGVSGSNPFVPCYAVQAPDIDGSYGENVDGIFFFTTEGAYVEWKGDYMMSDQPLKLTTTPELVRQIQ